MIGTISLGPTGNKEGNHFFYCLVRGSFIFFSHLTALPKPTDIIPRISDICCLQ
jgi:hypothetical protein